MTLRACVVASLLALSGCASLNVAGEGTAAVEPDKGDERPSPEKIVEAMKGGLIGGSIGEGFGEADRARALEAEYRALEHTPSGQAVIWRTSDPARHGEVVAAPPYRVGSQDCRQYVHTVHIGAEQRVARGTACRNADGSWTPLT